ncbi:hypothetical protein A3709_11090 [Halioglobus sp. HI00S01]|uniref:DUF3429 domain-containing protein n=1 Tax=Halioglobus sp. HI00S01 TaxID=1822214 RepID=UPI0007C2F5F1|nr:DUF3429 domain-containing protein [Halioglobus sp. HI00S01]KZX51354.1 hypothetical protein A3709_11090 [Halioglobus sp. HI00S01]
MSTRSLMASLGYAGLIPFYGSAGWALTGLPGADWAIELFIVYAVAILAFLGGTLWGYAVQVGPDSKRLRLVLSNAAVLFAVVAALVGSPLVSISMLALGQVLVLMYERSGRDSRDWYIRLRTRLTLGVLPAHGVAALAVS